MTRRLYYSILEVGLHTFYRSSRRERLMTKAISRMQNRLTPLMGELRAALKILTRYAPGEALHRIGMKIDSRSLSYYRFAEPEILGFEPTTICNIKCIMCGGTYWDNPDRGHLSYGDFVKIISQFHHLQLLHFSGIGEPLINPEMTGIVRFAVKKAQVVGLNTNATLLSEDVSRELCEAGLGMICASIDGATAETFEKIRMGAKFDTVLDNLRILQEIKRKLGRDKPELVIRTVLMKRNLNELPEILSLAAELGASTFAVERVMYADPVKSYFHIPESLEEENTYRLEMVERTTEILEQCSDLARERRINLRLPPRKVDPLFRTPFRCPLVWTTPYITRQGFLMPCCNLVEAREKEVNMGNLLETHFSRIWNSQKYRAFRESILSDNPYPKCRRCTVFLGIV